MSKNDEYVTISAEEAEQIKAGASATGNRPFSPVTKALLEGETVFLVERFSYNTKTFTKMGMKLRSTRGERNGKKGVYVWAEPGSPAE